MSNIHIISHSHWDREWYMSFEQHRQYLIELLDEVIEQAHTNSAFNSFHLDGQVIMLFDYLKVRPDKKKIIEKLVKENKICIGPWYILQDAFLTSSEANIRNMQYGQKISAKFGKTTKIGYFPDTFGIYSQAAQILKKSNIENIFFGRGVTPTGFNNEAKSSMESQFSEMFLIAPDGSKILAFLFANWYCNANEIKDTKQWWQQKIKDAQKFSSCDELLMMNGCDHQPLQENLTQLIESSQKLMPEHNFLHTNLESYVERVISKIDKKNSNTIKGELRSQNTDGYYTLVNTSSSHIYLKIRNYEVQNLIEKHLEVLMVLFNAQHYQDQLQHTWLTLMENHPHDSICGCSCDTVHRQMEQRFDDAQASAKHLINTMLYKFAQKGIKNANENLVSLCIFNTLSINQYVHEVEFDLQRSYFHDFGYKNAYQRVKDFSVKDLTFYNSQDEKISFEIMSQNMVFDYELNHKSFRKPYYACRVRAKISSLIEAYSYETIKIKEEKFVSSVFVPKIIDFEVNSDGSLTLINLKTNEKLLNLLQIYDEGDIGNEYMFGQVKGDEKIFVDPQKTTIKQELTPITKRVILTTTLMLPQSADEMLNEEQLALVGFYERNSKRSLQVTSQQVKIIYELSENQSFVKIKILLNNKCADHRLRVRFNLDCQKIEADSIFDVVNRPISVSEPWKNEHNDQHLSNFLCVNRQLVIATKGLHEYEAQQKYVDLTLLRAVGELGDWGYFKTQYSQMLQRDIQINLALGFYEKDSFEKARMVFEKLHYVQVFKTNEAVANRHKWLDFFKTDNVCITSLKLNFKGEKILRCFSLGHGELKITGKWFTTNLLEQQIYSQHEAQLNDREILTLINKE